jgi:hypothetical protein
MKFLPGVLLMMYAACGAVSGDDRDEDTGQALVGGTPETGYPSTGYLAVGDSPEPQCGITLLRNDVAVTAAHCLVNQGLYGGTRFGVGLGKKGSGPIHPVRRAVPSSDYARPVSAADVALLLLEAPIDGAATARIVDAPAGCSSRYIGYGRETLGGINVEDGYSGERKSTPMCVDSVDAGLITGHAESAALCWGDSGGPLMVDATNQIVGVLSGFAGTPTCALKDEMSFASLRQQRSFIDCFLERAATPGPSALVFPDVLCSWFEPFLDVVGAPLAARSLAADDESHFSGHSGVRRAEFAPLVVPTLSPIPVRADKSFGDLGDWEDFSGALHALYRAGVLSDDADGNIHPWMDMKRVDVLQALVTALRLPAADPGLLDAFVDAGAVPVEARAAVAAAFGAGLIVAHPDQIDPRKLDPLGWVTRSDVVAFVAQAMVYLGRAPTIASPYIVTP